MYEDSFNDSMRPSEEHVKPIPTRRFGQNRRYNRPVLAPILAPIVIKQVHSSHPYPLPIHQKGNLPHINRLSGYGALEK